MQTNRLVLSKGDVNEEKTNSNTWTNRYIFTPGWNYLPFFIEPEQFSASSFDVIAHRVGKRLFPL